MTDNIILICISFVLPLVLIIADKLIDRTAIKRKDKEIDSLTESLGEAVVKATTAETERRINQSVAEQVSNVAQQRVSSGDSRSEMLADAKKVSSLEEALEIARRQVKK